MERSDGIATTIDANYAKGLDNHGARTGVAEVYQASDAQRHTAVPEGVRHLGDRSDTVRARDGRA